MKQDLKAYRTKLFKLFGGSLIVVSAFSCQQSKNVSDLKTDLKPEPSVGTSSLTCQEFIKSLGPDYQTATIKVHENEADVTSPLIDVFYYYPKFLKLNLNQNPNQSIEQTKSTKVVVFFNGGPGGDSHSSYDVLDKALDSKKLKEKIAVVYIDQRGNGCSSGYPKIDQNDFQQVLRLTHYGSEDIVRDAEKIRKALIGDRQWIVFGQSYGGYIVHRYISMFPQSIEKAFSHAGSVVVDARERNIARILSQVNVWDKYFEKFPADRTKLSKLLNYLKNHPDLCFAQGENEQQVNICGMEILDGLTTYLGFNRWDILNSTIRDFFNDAGDIEENYLSYYVMMNYEAPASSSYNLALSVISTVDRGTLGFTVSHCLDIQKTIQERTKTDISFYFTECSSMLVANTQQSSSSEDMKESQLKLALAPYVRLATAEDVKAGLLMMPEKSFYVYSGDLDTFVPAGSILPELNIFGSLVNYTHFMNTGHDGFFKEDQIFADMLK